MREQDRDDRSQPGRDEPSDAAGHAGFDLLTPGPSGSYFECLPRDIQAAIDEWADHLRQQSWALRRRAMLRFAESFADNFLFVMPHLTAEDHEVLRRLGLTCLLERLDGERTIEDPDQARCFVDSIDAGRQELGRFYLGNAGLSGQRSMTLH